MVNCHRKIDEVERETPSCLTIKCITSPPPILAYPDHNAPFVVHTRASTDASRHGLKAVPYQNQQGTPRVIAYISRNLSPSKRNKRDYLYYSPQFVVYIGRSSHIRTFHSKAQCNRTTMDWRTIKFQL